LGLRPGRPLSVLRPRVTIGFVYCLPRLAGLLPALLAAGCNPLPDYPPPAQREAPSRPDPVALSYFLNVANPNAAAYIVKDVGDKTEGGGFRWAFAHPVLRFMVPLMDHPKFVMDFFLPEPAFRVTGPLTLTFSLNGRFFDKQRFAQMGQQHYQHDVADGFLLFGAINLMSIDPDKVFVAEDGARLSFPFSRVGFTE
jgi:hypothetical protein